MLTYKYFSVVVGVKATYDLNLKTTVLSVKKLL